MPLIPHGFPDWYRLSGRSDEVFLDVSANNLANSPVYGPFFVGMHQALGLRFAATTTNVEIILTFMDAPGGTTLMVQRIGVQQGCRFNGSIPIVGPYVQVQVFFGPAAATFVIRLWSMQVAAMASDFLASASVLFMYDNVNVAAGAVVNEIVADVWPGEANWFVLSNASTYRVLIQTLDRTGGTRLIDRASQLTNGQRRSVFLPPQTVRLQIVNGDAAAQAFHIALTARPMWLGA